jgi:magnesium-transporting ATPase (P-type)
MASNQIVDFFIFFTYLRFSDNYFYFKDRTFSVINLTNKPLFCLTYPLKIKKKRKKKPAQHLLREIGMAAFIFRICLTSFLQPALTG